MVAILRRRRFIFIFLICSALFILYSIKVRSNSLNTFRSTPITNHNDVTRFFQENLSNNIPPASESNKDTTHLEKQFSDFNNSNAKDVTMAGDQQPDSEEQFVEIEEMKTTKAIIKTSSDKDIVSIEKDNLEQIDHETPTTSQIILKILHQTKDTTQFRYHQDLKLSNQTDPDVLVEPDLEEQFVEIEAMETTKAIIKTSSDKDIVSMEKDNLERNRLEIPTTSRVPPITRDLKRPGLILDTPGCKIPKLDPWERSVFKFASQRSDLVCPGPPLFMKSQPDGSIALNGTVLKIHYNLKPDEIKCGYQSIHREHEAPQQVRENNFIGSHQKPLEFGVPLNEDYVAVSCKMADKYFEQYFPLVRLKKEVEDERNLIHVPEPRLNVILIGIDSVSKLNFIRYLRRTRKFLEEKLSAFEMNGYTKVADNTFPNLVPLLTGHFVEHYWNEKLRNIMFFDEIDLIWKEYAKKGYRTFYAEDNPLAGTFNYLKRGFYDPPTDYYYRPLGLALELSRLRNESRVLCLNSQLETDFIYDYMRDFIQVMEPRPYFAFTMVSSITHDDLSAAEWADKPTLGLVEDLWNSGALNNSFFVLFSDHGLRFGDFRRTYLGKFEDRMPFMYIYVPKWFHDLYPEYTKNLHINQDRLMTLFDVHATMVHLLDPNKEMTPEKTASVTLGTSLFNEIPSNRSCEDANIRPHWCPCQTLHSVSLDNPGVVKAAQTIADNINSQLQPFGHSCETLMVAEILDARYSSVNDFVLRFEGVTNWVLNKTIIYGERVNPIGDYMVTIKTRPGNAEFEGTVRHDPDIDWYFVQGISRINVYGNQSWCINSQKLKIFCYCKIQFH